MSQPPTENEHPTTSGMLSASSIPTAARPSTLELSAAQIQELLPHRDIMLLVDRVWSILNGEASGAKLVSANDPWLRGHFSGHPVFPGVLILEALAQLACIALVFDDPRRRGLLPVLVGVDDAQFGRPVVPGDELELRVRTDRARSRLVRVEGAARVRGELAAAGVLLASFVRPTVAEQAHGAAAPRWEASEVSTRPDLARAGAAGAPRSGPRGAGGLAPTDGPPPSLA
jgi:3-hydroxyacyl-[acyl-carrier-protein] dehydratase